MYTAFFCMHLNSKGTFAMRLFSAQLIAVTEKIRLSIGHCLSQVGNYALFGTVAISVIFRSFFIITFN